MKRIILVIAFLPLLFACGGGKKESADSDAAKVGTVSKPNLVDTIVLRRGTFDRQIISNGKLRAVVKSDIAFRNDGVISKIFAGNGDYVSKGTIIATLDERQARLQYESAQLKLDKAKLDFSDALIGYGYGNDTAKVPKDLLEIIKIRSGYKSALSEFANSRIALENTNLIAPVSGKIANLSKKPYEISSGVLCSVIDDSRFETDFNLLEAELVFVKKGSAVEVEPFSEPGKRYKGIITNINPYVDDKGQIKISALISNSDGKLLEGMNVKVIVENRVFNKLVVPKSAVVMRDNFDVLFRFDPATGKAMWTYVTVEMSNTGYHAVIANSDKNAELNPGDIIIVSGNLNLANDSNVEIKRK
jgi:multidrug efflux pump subunit AcrA (membrane-fusion protein)